MNDPSEIPVPPEEVHIRDLRGVPYLDGKRVRVYVELDPFQKRPSLEITIWDPAGTRVAQTRVIETMTRKLEMTMHLGQCQPGAVYALKAMLYYEPPLKAREDLAVDEESQGDAEAWVLTEVDQRQVLFTIESCEADPIIKSS